MRPPFSIKWIYLIEWKSFGQKYKFSNKNDMVSAWRNFKNIFPRPLFIIIFRPEMLKFHPYSILTGDTRVEFVIYCVLKQGRDEWSSGAASYLRHYNKKKCRWKWKTQHLPLYLLITVFSILSMMACSTIFDLTKNNFTLN